MSHPSILIHRLHYQIPNTAIAWKDINLSFVAGKTAIVGKNGVGKTTLLHILQGSLQPSQGSVVRHGSCMYLPQHNPQSQAQITVADALGVSGILAALTRIGAGSVHPEDFNTVGTHWDITDKIQQACQRFNFWPLDLDAPLKQLSCGQQTKVLLAKIAIFNPDIILLDEPSNHLDQQSRQILYDFITHSSALMVIVSHDRCLLEHMHNIIEINAHGFQHYSGNYQQFLQKKQQQQQIDQKNLQDAKNDLQQRQRQAQQNREAHQRRKGRGRQQLLSGKTDKLTSRHKQGRSEKSHQRITHIAQQRQQQQLTQVASAQDAIEVEKRFDLRVHCQAEAKSKQIIEIIDLYFKYPKSSKQLFNHFNLLLKAGSRTAICGNNGCGKSTLLQLINSQLQADSGTINIYTNDVAYLDQQVSLLKPQLTVLENYLHYHPQTSIQHAYTACASAGFPNQKAQQRAASLSGGERMRAGLSITLLAHTPPQLILLDEPNNHLDLNTQFVLEQALQKYQGTLLVVSHDPYFLRQIAIDRYLQLTD